MQNDLAMPLGGGISCAQCPHGQTLLISYTCKKQPQPPIANENSFSDLQVLLCSGQDHVHRGLPDGTRLGFNETQDSSAMLYPLQDLSWIGTCCIIALINIR